MKPCSQVRGFGTNFHNYVLPLYSLFGNVNGTLYVCIRPHYRVSRLKVWNPVTMQDMDGTLITVPTSVLINAKAEERKVSDLFVRTEFVGKEEGKETIERIKSVYNRQFSNGTLVIVGSIIAAQAYPGEVAAMTPVEGYERVAPDQKRMRCDKFTTFA